MVPQLAPTEAQVWQTAVIARLPGSCETTAEARTGACATAASTPTVALEPTDAAPSAWPASAPGSTSSAA